MRKATLQNQMRALEHHIQVHGYMEEIQVKEKEILG